MAHRILLTMLTSGGGGGGGGGGSPFQPGSGLSIAVALCVCISSVLPAVLTFVFNNPFRREKMFEPSTDDREQPERTGKLFWGPPR